MTALPPIHLCVTQPAGYLHSLGFLDQARYFRHQFRRLGADVSLAKNRLRHGAINFVFGAHLGFDAAARRRYHCVFVNLEQIGHGGAAVPNDYLSLLAASAVVDYDAQNARGYATHPDEVPVVPLLYAPYLRPAEALRLEERPIDLLFIGAMNERRRALIERIEAQGVQVARFDSPLYGPERDAFIAQSKAVLNAHFYPTSRFEQARVSTCLSLGTPVICERTPLTQPHPAFEDSVLWLAEADLERFFSQHFATPAFYDQARAALARFAEYDPIEAYADVLAYAVGYANACESRREPGPWRPKHINLGSGKDYRAGWLNIDVIEQAEPDLVLDLGRPQQWPLAAHGMYAGPVLLEAGKVDLIYANNVLEHVPDLPMLMGNALALLAEGGQFAIEVPYEHAPTAWQDPTHLRALNENSWIYYTDWFWYLGWFEHRFEMTDSSWLDDNLKPCDKSQAAFMKVLLTKVATTPRERTTARVMRADFGGIDEDLPQVVGATLPA